MRIPSTTDEEDLLLVYNVLITCDDGISSIGLAKLAQSISDLDVNIYICAPDSERSASSQSLTIRNPIVVKEAHCEGVTYAKCWQTSGTPCDCVKLAIEKLMPHKPDLVLSGINNGLNIGEDVYYSGTVSAAREGVLNGIQSVAFSARNYNEDVLKKTLDIARKIVCRLIDEPLPDGTLLNVNVPKSLNDSPDVRVVKTGNLNYTDVFDKRCSPRGHEYYWLAGHPDFSGLGNDCDVDCVQGGFVAITPIKIDLTNYEFFEKLKKWNF